MLAASSVPLLSGLCDDAFPRANVIQCRLVTAEEADVICQNIFLEWIRKTTKRRIRRSKSWVKPIGSMKLKCPAITG